MCYIVVAVAVIVVVAVLVAVVVVAVAVVVVAVVIGGRLYKKDESLDQSLKPTHPGRQALPL